MAQPRSLSIIVPALNEEGNIVSAVERVVADCGRAGIDWEVIIVDDGSTDATGPRADELCRRYPSRMKALHHERPRGIGCSIRDGVRAAAKDAVTWVPGDGENDPYEIIKYLPLLEHVDFIVPFVINKGIRSKPRQRLSKTFVSIINATFGTNFHYTNGNVIYKRMVFDRVRQQSDGFFFQTECVVKASRAGFTFAEVPIRIRAREGGRSKALTLKSLRTVVGEYVRLIRAVYFTR